MKRVKSDATIVKDLGKTLCITLKGWIKFLDITTFSCYIFNWAEGHLNIKDIDIRSKLDPELNLTIFYYEIFY